MIRVLALTNFYPPHALGGYEWSCHDVLSRFVARGHDVSVLTTTTMLPDVSTDELLGDVHRDLEWYWDDHELISPSVLDRLRIERRNQRRLADALARHQPDVVSVWNVGAMSLGLLRSVADRGIPMVFAVCDEWPIHAPEMDAWTRLFTDRPRLGAIGRRVLGVPCRLGDLGPTGAWCFVSEHTRRSCVEHSRFSFPITSVVHSGIDAVDFPVDVRRDEGFGWRLLCVGRLDERKGVLTAVDALARLPKHATLQFLGRGPADAPIRERAIALGVADRVHIGDAPRAELRARYQAADVFLFTSEWEEPFGLTPIEAMACGTPVVGTGTGGSGDFLVDGVTCLRYPAGDAAALAQAVERLAADPALRDRIRAGGAALARHRTTDRLADVLEAWHLAAARGFAEGTPEDDPLLPADFPEAHE